MITHQKAQADAAPDDKRSSNERTKYEFDKPSSGPRTSRKWCRWTQTSSNVGVTTAVTTLVESIGQQSYLVDKFFNFLQGLKTIFADVPGASIENMGYTDILRIYQCFYRSEVTPGCLISTEYNKVSFILFSPKYQNEVQGTEILACR